MLSASQLALRRNGIGSSDIAAVVGADPNREAIVVWLEKRGLLEREESPEMETGNDFEGSIADAYARRTGSALRTCGTFVHPRIPYAMATPDRLVVNGNVPMVEVKNVGLWARHEWDEGAPLRFELQIQWQMLVCGFTRADLVALICGTDLRIYRIERDDELLAGMLDMAEEFWGYVVSKTAPPSSGAGAYRAAKARWRQSNGLLLPATSEAERLRDELARLTAEAKRVEDEAAAAEARLMALIGEADGIEGVATWRSDKTGKVSWKAVAEEAGASQALIARHTGTPSRRLLMKGTK